jgi:hypothetical protein
MADFNALLGQVFFPLQLPSFATCARQFPDRSYLDTAHASGRHLRSDLDSLVQVGGLNQIEPCQALLRFRERAIPDGHLSLADPHSSRCMNRLKGLRGKASAALSERLVVSHAVIVGHGPNFLFFTVDKA